jgi:hypothetical protein
MIQWDIDQLDTDFHPPVSRWHQLICGVLELLTLPLTKVRPTEIPYPSFSGSQAQGGIWHTGAADIAASTLRPCEIPELNLHSLVGLKFISTCESH